MQGRSGVARSNPRSAVDWRVTQAASAQEAPVSYFKL
jgi:hypothetical protein